MSSLVTVHLRCGGMLGARAWSHVVTNRKMSAVSRATEFLLCKRTNTQSGCLGDSSSSSSNNNNKFLATPSPFASQHGTFRSLSSLLMTAADDDDVEATKEQEKTIDSTWDIPGLKKEVGRMVLRSHKKIGKASTKLRKAREVVEKLRDESSSAEPTLEELEQCPNLDAIELEMKELQDRLAGLNSLEEALTRVKKKKAVLSKEIASLALNLGVNDQPPPRPPRGPGRRKGPRAASDNNNNNNSRKPYRRYYSQNNMEIRVGKKAEDNDELSLSPKHRDGSDWWMHASGCPGSHVVIRCGDDKAAQAQLPEEVIRDAASLAARQSKCNNNQGRSVIKVSLTRCRDVKKPPGAKAGLVQLTGKVRTVSVSRKEMEERFARLEKTVRIN